MGAPFRAILFDFDYTLADSSEPIIDCFNTGLRGLGLPEAAPDTIRRTIGLSLEESLVAVAGEEHREHAREFRRHWRRRSDHVMVAGTRVFDWAPAAIEKLAASGFRLGIVSTKYRTRIEEVLHREGLDKHFEAIVGGDDVARHKPDPEGLLHALDRMGAAREETLYVGDSVVDAEAARRADTAFAAVLTGVTQREAFAELPAWAVLQSVAELPEAM